MSYNTFLKLLIEIFDGYTRFGFKGQTLFFKHSGLREQNLLKEFYDEYLQIALKKGIETEEDVFKRLREEKSWTEDDDLKISELQFYVDNLKKTKSKLFLPSQKDAHQKLIDEEEQKLNELLRKKTELVPMTAEQYASKMSTEEYLRVLVYEDQELKKLKFSKEDFGTLSISEISEINSTFLNCLSSFSEENIQKITLEDFFSMYLSMCEDGFAFFGKNICNLSAYQMKLLLYGKIFNNIFQYHDDIPENIKKDPKAIFAFVDSKKNREKYQNDTRDKDGSMLFGATKEDLDILDPSASKISLSEQLAKNGGSLSMEDMINLMGN